MVISKCSPSSNHERLSIRKPKVEHGQGLILERQSFQERLSMKNQGKLGCDHSSMGVTDQLTQIYLILNRSEIR